MFTAHTCRPTAKNLRPEPIGAVSARSSTRSSLWYIPNMSNHAYVSLSLPPPPLPPPPSLSFVGEILQVYFVHEMSLIVWKERVFEALKERLRRNTMRVVNAAREKNLTDLDDNDAVKSLLKT